MVVGAAVEHVEVGHKAMAWLVVRMEKAVVVLMKGVALRSLFNAINAEVLPVFASSLPQLPVEKAAFVHRLLEEL